MAGLGRGLVERVDRRVLGGRERHVEVLGRLARDEREGPGRAGELDVVLLVVPDVQPGVRGDRRVERARRRDVRDADPQVVDHPVAAQVAVVDGLGAVAVRVEQERAVVVVAVLAARARLAGVAVAGAHARLPERLDVLARRRGEGDVQPPRHAARVLGLAEREVVRLVPEGRIGQLDPDRRKDRAVEAFRRRGIGGPDRDVVEHRPRIADRAAPYRLRPRGPAARRRVRTRASARRPARRRSRAAPPAAGPRGACTPG